MQSYQKRQWREASHNTPSTALAHHPAYLYQHPVLPPPTPWSTLNIVWERAIVKKKVLYIFSTFNCSHLWNLAWRILKSSEGKLLTCTSKWGISLTCESQSNLSFQLVFVVKYSILRIKKKSYRIFFEEELKNWKLKIFPPSSKCLHMLWWP